MSARARAQMEELSATLERDVQSLDGVQAGLQSRGAELVQRAAELHARIDACGALALDQVPPPPPPSAARRRGGDRTRI